MASTATIDEQEQAAGPLVSTPDTQLLFMSRRDSLRLTLKSRYPVRDPVSGQPAGMTAGEYVGFREGVFRCPPEGTMLLVDTLDGGEVEVDAAGVVARLKKHRLFMNREEGFWLVDPAAPPVSKDEIKALMRAAMMLDVDALERALGDEQGGWNRPDMIESIEENLQTAREMLAEAEKHRAEAEAEQAKTAKAEKPAK